MSTTTDDAAPESAGPSGPTGPTGAARVKQRLARDDRGQTGPMNQLVGLVIAIGVALYVAAALLIPAAQNYAGANKSNLTATQKTIAALVTIFAVLGLAIAFIKAAMSAV